MGKAQVTRLQSRMAQGAPRGPVVWVQVLGNPGGLAGTVQVPTVGQDQGEQDVTGSGTNTASASGMRVVWAASLGATTGRCRLGQLAQQGPNKQWAAPLALLSCRRAPGCPQYSAHQRKHRSEGAAQF